MGTNTTFSGLKLLGEHQKPIMIRSIDGYLQGSLDLQNETDSKVTLKSMPIKAPKLRNKSLEPLSEARLFGKLYPNECGKISFNVPIDPSTPPGSYEATIQVGDKKLPAQILITENIELEVEPDTILLNVSSKNVFKRDFEFSNIGNTAVSIDGDWPVTLKSQQGMETDIIHLLRDACDGVSNAENHDAVAEILCNVANTYPGSAKVSFEKVTIKPGETTTVGATISLPDNIQNNMHYIADLDLYSANIQLDVYKRG